MKTVDKDLIIAKYKKRSRIMSVITGFMVLLTFVFLVYGLVQKGIADEKQLEATANAERAFLERKKAKECTEETERERRVAFEMAENLKALEKK